MLLRPGPDQYPRSCTSGRPRAHVGCHERAEVCTSGQNSAAAMRQAVPVPTGPEIRPLTGDDGEAADALAAEAFGAAPRPLPDPWPAPGARPWGAFHGRELAAVATVRDVRVVVRRRHGADGRDRERGGPTRAPRQRPARAAVRRTPRGRPRARRGGVRPLPDRARHLPPARLRDRRRARGCGGAGRAADPDPGPGGDRAAPGGPGRRARHRRPPRPLRPLGRRPERPADARGAAAAPARRARRRSRWPSTQTTRPSVSPRGGAPRATRAALRPSRCTT